MKRGELLVQTRRLALGFLGSVVLLGAVPAPADLDEASAWAGALSALDVFPAVVPHITLDASLPEDEGTVEGEVTEVRLFFSDAPLMRGASIRVVNSSRKLVRSSPPAADEEDPKQLAVQLPSPLEAGTYVVQWRCIADDGHVMRGSFTFDVVAD